MEDQLHLFWTFVIALCWFILLAAIGGALAWWLYSKRRRERRRAAGRAARQLAKDWREGRLPTSAAHGGAGHDGTEPSSNRRVERRKTWRID
jgi:hypothetical protein